MRNADPRLHGLRKGQWSKVIALRLYDQTNGLARMNIQRSMLDQIGIHCRIEPAVIDDVIHMPIDIVVRPARADIAKYTITAALLWLCPACFGDWISLIQAFCSPP